VPTKTRSAPTAAANAPVAVYEWAVPLADDLYDTYRAELRDEGLI
jgi:hypothetical protein